MDTKIISPFGWRVTFEIISPFLQDLTNILEDINYLALNDAVTPHKFEV